MASLDQTRSLEPRGRISPMSAGAVPVVRVAAVADIHLPRDRWDPPVEALQRQADLLVIAGDVTAVGVAEEAEAAADKLARFGLPVFAVLGNHDHHSGEPEVVAEVLGSYGVTVLEGDAVTIEVRGIRVGIAGVKGFGGGFEGATAHEFGEDLMKSFVAHTRERAAALETALSSLKSDVRIAIVHYAPCTATLAGEPVGLYPFLGSYLLGEAIDVAGADLALHGHAHLGTERGKTRQEVPVRNVARPVINADYRVYEVASVRAEKPRGQQAEDEWMRVEGGRLWEVS